METTEATRKPRTVIKEGQEVVICGTPCTVLKVDENKWCNAHSSNAQSWMPVAWLTELIDCDLWRKKCDAQRKELSMLRAEYGIEQANAIHLRQSRDAWQKDAEALSVKADRLDRGVDRALGLALLLSAVVVVESVLLYLHW
jgi:hypothetical protein